jgi:hypothetical protein
MKGSDMNIRKLVLTGKVHNDPNRMISSYYSWPLYATMEEVGCLIDQFARAFENIIADIDIVPCPTVDFIKLNMVEQ